jgi:hypothetical protein
MAQKPAKRAGLLALGVCCLLHVSAASSGVEPASDGYAPVSPASAIHAAVQSSLKLVQDWLADKDFLSATEASQELTAVAQLYAYQSARPDWRSRTAILRETCLRLTAATRAKDADRCAKAVAECQRTLSDLATDPPPAEKAVQADFRPFGSNKVWMLLMDGAYTDAKTAKSASDVESLAYQIAEEASVVGHLRPEARWRQLSVDVRETALAVAQQARTAGLDVARRELKSVYLRCEACHQGYKR